MPLTSSCETGMFHNMSAEAVSIRELRINFRSVRKKIEEFGSITITDNGSPAYVISRIPKKRSSQSAMPDYYARLLKYQPKPLTREKSRALHDLNRGDR
jgi:hypothetical protein